MLLHRKPMPASKARSYLIDMDGVLVHGPQPIPGAAEFLARLRATGSRFLAPSNNSIYTPKDLSHRLRRIGIDVSPAEIFTSAMATDGITFTKSRNQIRNQPKLPIRIPISM